MNTIVFDIETGPLPESEIAQYCPTFEAPTNYKDFAKVEAYIENKKKEWFEKAALSPVTGEVLAIGVIKDDIFLSFACGNEAEDIASFWEFISNFNVVVNRAIGFNSNSFDIPFLIRRSWKLGVKVPDGIFQGKYIGAGFIDILDSWRCGNKDQTIKLDALAKFLGVGEKTGSGAEFASLFKRDQKSAISYLENDVRITKLCAQRLGIL